MPQDTFNPHAAPYTSVVRITDDLPDGSSWEGSGVLISPDEVLTAGHVVYRTGVGDATNFAIKPDTEGLPPPYQYYGGAVTHSDTSITNYPYLTTDATSHDYAVIHLSLPIIGASTMKVVAGAPVVNAHITGFPAWAGNSMVDDVQTLSQVSGAATYQGSTDGGIIAGGISGGPVWNYAQDGSAQVFGVDSSANSAGYAYFSDFTAAEAAQINAWVAQDDYVPPPITLASVLGLSQPTFDTIAGQMRSDTSGDTSEVVDLYHAALGRAPDVGGMEGWVSQLQQGVSLETIAGGFIGSAEFVARYGGLDNPSFTTRLYENTLNREPEPAGLAYWKSGLDNGVSRAATLVGFAVSPEDKGIVNQMFGVSA